MGKRLNHYHIKISFDKKRTECSVGNIYAKYMSGKENQDSFHFLSDSFTIIASRSKTFDDGTILSNNINSINSQTSNPQLSSSASFLRLNVLSSLN